MKYTQIICFINHFFKASQSIMTHATLRGTGWGKWVSLLSFIGLFTILPEMVRIILAHMQEYKAKDVYSILTMGIINGVLIVYNGVMYFVYRAKHPFFQQYRINDKAWPWQDNPQKWKQTLSKTFRSVVLNSFVIVPLCMLPDLLIFDCKYLTSLDTWPSVPVMLGQFFLFMLVEDCVFYFSHSLLHHPSLYWIHKQHHEYYNTICITAVYAHPIEAVLGNMVPMYLGYRVLSVYAPVHMVTICVWLLFRMMETCENHSGYEWSWGQLSFFPWKLGSDYHNFHHSHNVGNFGSMFGFWDSIMGTNAHYLKFKKTEQST